MKIISEPIVIIDILCENLNTLNKGHSTCCFNTMKNILSNCVIILQIISVYKFFLYNFYLNAS